MTTDDFEPFPKIARLYRDVVISEKIDGTNAQVVVGEDGSVRAASRTRYITPEDDNYGFARWVAEHADGLRDLGPGRHFGEWWGLGIQRNYSQTRKRFSLFNVARWGAERPECCDVVPVIYQGVFTIGCVPEAVKRLRNEGSLAAPGFMKPEGIIVWHEAARQLFKVTVENDTEPKAVADKRLREAVAA